MLLLTCNTFEQLLCPQEPPILRVSEIVSSVEVRSVWCSLVVRSINYFAHKNLHLWSSKVVNSFRLTRTLTRSFVTMSEQNLPGGARANQDAQAPQQPSPVPLVRLSIRTPPIPARRTSITSATGSFELRSPFTFGGFGPSTLLTVTLVVSQIWSGQQLKPPILLASMMALAMDLSEVLALDQFMTQTLHHPQLHSWFAIRTA